MNTQRHTSGTMFEEAFSGEYDRSVDGAGRVTLPSTLRELLGERCYATKDPQGCVTLRTPARYVEEANKIERREEKGKAGKGSSRAFSTRTVILAVDKQGRVTLDESSREFAKIQTGGQVFVVGHKRAIELWQPNRWAVVKSEDAFGEPDRVWPAHVDGLIVDGLIVDGLTVDG